MNVWYTLLLAIALGGCIWKSHDPVSNVVTAPLSDLNIVHAEIPPLLKAASSHPYLIPIDTSCEALAAAVKALDELLGPDVDAAASRSNPSLLQRGTTAAGGEVLNAMQGAAQGVVPFRRWVRQLSGAERYSKKVAAAIIAGAVRRSFLKGYAIAQGCDTLQVDKLR